MKISSALGKIHVPEAGIVLVATHVGEESLCPCTSDGTGLFFDYFVQLRSMTFLDFIKTQSGSGQCVASD